MLVNFLILVILLVLTIGAGWLALRALRAKRLWVKIAGGLGAGLLTLALAGVAFLGGKGFVLAYFPGEQAAPDLRVAGTPEQIARGDYLVNLSCIGCHSAVGPDGNPSGEHPLSGGWNLSEGEGFGFIGAMIAENLTPGGKLATYSDGELFRVIRAGISKDGRRLGIMGLMASTELSDEDTQAIIAYLRSLPPVENSARTGDYMSFLGLLMNGAGMFGTPAKYVASIDAPPQGVSAAYGKYVATFGDCRGCHGSDMTGAPASSISAAVPNPRPLVSSMTLEQFVTTMRTGVKPSGDPFPVTMPWQNASKMTDDDLAALYTYLTTQP
jgi:mono/diheme cytochrome c family protein